MARRGFSLVELLIAVATLAIVSAVVAPRYASSMANYRAGAAGRRVAGDIALAQASARAGSASRRVSFDPDNGRYTIEGVTAADALPGTPRGVNTVVRLAGEPYRAKLISADFGGRAAITFDGFGKPDSGGTVVLVAGGRSVTVKVAAETGATSVE